MPDQKKEDGKLTFVVTTNPYDSSSAVNRKRVRSIAALKSWPERRKRTFEQSDQSTTNQGGFVLDNSVTTAGPSQPGTTKRNRNVTPVSSSSADPSRVTQQAFHQPEFYDAEEDLFEKCTRALDADCKCVHCRTERRYTYGPYQGQVTRHVAFPHGKKRMADGAFKPTVIKGDLALLTPPSSPSPSPLAMVNNVGRAEPFNCYPVPYRPWFDRVLHHMMTVFAPRGWPALKITNAEGLLWESFMTRHALAEPALFYVRLLFATGDLIRLKVLNPEVSYWVQAQSIQAINEALGDRKRAISDPLILAVGRIALHETLYGDKKAAATIHRPAQKRMISIRGGMRELPFPDLVKRLMRWADKVMAMQTGTERILEDDEQNQNFSMDQHVSVLEKWVPREGRDLRKKIKISDLLSPDPS